MLVWQWVVGRRIISRLINFCQEWVETSCTMRSVKPRLHDTTCCQTGCQTSLTTDEMFVYTIQQSCQTSCIVYTAGCQTGCTTRFDNRLNEQWLFVQHDCQTGCQTGLYNRFDNRLYRVNGVLCRQHWTNFATSSTVQMKATICSRKLYSILGLTVDKVGLNITIRNLCYASEYKQ